MVKVGSTLSATPASVTGDPTPVRSWQWLRNNVTISGATAANYYVQAADEGAKLSVRQIETNFVGVASATSAQTATVGAYDPGTLFESGEVGAWYDPSDLTTVFQDAAGTTPATVGDPVGLILDKSQGLTLGSERVADSSLWSGSANWSIDTANDKATLTNAASSSDNLSLGTLTGSHIGQVFAVTFTLESISGGSVLVLSSRATNPGQIFYSPGTYTYYASVSIVGIGGLSVAPQMAGVSCVVSNISIRELPGNHATQTTSAARPVLQIANGTPVLSGSELVTNGTFDTDTTGWYADSGFPPASFVWNAGSMVVTGSGASYNGVETLIPTQIGKTYIISADITGGYMSVDKDAPSSGWAPTNNVTMFTATNSQTGIVAAVNGSNVGTFDNISVQEVTSWTGGQYYLDFDGVDDWLGDVVFGSPIPVPMTYSIAARWSGNGSFSTNEYLLDSTSSNRHTIYKNTADIINVFVGTNVSLSPSTTLGADELLTIDVQGPSSSSIRRNGAVAQSGLSLNASLSQFRLANYYGGSGIGALYLEGRIYGMVLTSRTLTAAEITDLETYLAAKSGVTL